MFKETLLLIMQNRKYMFRRFVALLVLVLCWVGIALILFSFIQE